MVDIIVSPIGNKADGVIWFCCADHDATLFEKQYPVTDGMTYNSYIIKDKKVAVMDAVDHAVEAKWLDKVKEHLTGSGIESPDYLIVQHLEPDHSASIGEFMTTYPDCLLVCSAKAATMLPHFANGISHERVVEVREGEELDLGSRRLKFMMAPMVHWPEVMVTYDSRSKILFSADAFGTFGSTLPVKIAGGGQLVEDEWRDEARRYFINICGKYGAQVQSLLKKLTTADVEYLCPLHGPVIKLDEFNPVPLYDLWSSYRADEPAKCLLVVGSLHGNTVTAAGRLSEMLKDRGVNSEVLDLSRVHSSEAVSKAFGAGTVVFMSATYDASAVPSVTELLARLKSKNWQARHAAIVENGSWAPVAGKVIADNLAGMKDISVIEPKVTIRTRLDEESESALTTLADEITKNVKTINQ